MNDRQKRFCEFYAENPDGTDAAIKAGYSSRTAASIASENLRKPELLNYIRTLQHEAAKLRIASLLEVRALWSDILRDISQKTSDRLKAGELLAKASGAFVHFWPEDVSVFTEEGKSEDVIIYLPQIDKEEDHMVNDPDTDEGVKTE